MQDIKDKSRYRSTMGYWQNVNEELKFQNISRKELSYKSGIPQTTIDKGIERDSDVSAINGIKIAKALGTSLESLLNLPEEKTAVKKQADKDSKFSGKYNTMLNDFETLSPAVKKEIISLIKTISDESAKAKKNL